MGEPDVVAEPAEIFEVLDGPHPVLIEAVLLLVLRLGQVGVQPHPAFARQLRRLGHQLAGYGERRARGKGDAEHRVG